MNEEDQPASLADQAAAWIPPWQRPAAAVVEPADDDEVEENEIQRPETDVVAELDDVVEPAAADPQDPPTFTGVAGSDGIDPAKFTEVVASEAEEPPNFTEVVGSDGAEPGNFTEVVDLEDEESDDFTDVAAVADDEPEDDAEPVAQDPDNVTDVVGFDGAEPDNVTDVVGFDGAEPDDFPEVVGLDDAGSGDVADVAAPALIDALGGSAGGRTPEIVEGERPANLAGALEAILLVVDEPVSAEVLAEVLAVSVDEANAALAGLAREYADQGRGFDLRRAAGGWRFYTRSEFASYVERFVLDGQSIRLTQAALETLAVIAYSQPVTRSRMSAIRGVNCDGVVRTLANRGLIEECGTQPDSGAFLYRTTDLFLEKLGLDSLVELPPLAPFLPDDVNGFADA